MKRHERIKINLLRELMITVAYELQDNMKHIIFNCLYSRWLTKLKKTKEEMLFEIIPDTA